jgi:mRNA interferase RelE/StbE
MYRVEFSRQADRAFDRLPEQVRKRMSRAINALVSNPLPSGATKLSGPEQTNLYRIRVGDYRVVYSIENERLVIFLVKIGHRREIYRDL